jgi:hypothetical protein
MIPAVLVMAAAAVADSGELLLVGFVMFFAGGLLGLTARLLVAFGQRD